MKKSYGHRLLKWQSELMKGEKVIYRPSARSKNYFYLYFLVQRLLGYYNHRVELILENRVVPMRYPERYGWIAIDEIAKERITKISSL